MIKATNKKYFRRRDYCLLMLKGFCMGVADVIPGISGGTIAFLLGIYEDLIVAIRSFDLKFVQLLLQFRFREALASVGWKFLVVLLTGIAAAVFTFSKIISWLMNNEPVFLYSFFFGLIFATVPLIARIMKRWTAGKVLSIILAAMVTYYVVGLVPVVTPEAPWFIFLSGALAICAMILPGISGAFILVLLGKYQFILDAVNSRDFLILGIFCLGIAVGITSFVRVLSWLFNKYHDVTIAVLTGIVIGSLRKTWPWKEITQTIITGHGKIIPVEEVNVFPAQFGGDVLLAIVIMGCGFILAFLLNSSSDGKLLS